MGLLLGVYGIYWNISMFLFYLHLVIQLPSLAFFLIMSDLRVSNPKNWDFEFTQDFMFLFLLLQTPLLIFVLHSLRTNCIYNNNLEKAKHNIEYLKSEKTYKFLKTDGWFWINDQWVRSRWILLIYADSA